MSLTTKIKEINTMEQTLNTIHVHRHLDADNRSEEIVGKKSGCYEHLLLHIPHSSTSFPSDTHFTFEDLDQDEQLLIDYYTDELFAPQTHTQDIIHAVFPYCRLYCDVERLTNDPLEKEGLGISYRRILHTSATPTLVRTFGNLSQAFHTYADFHAEVSKKLVDSALQHPTLLIDCHSFSCLPNLLNSNPPDIDICIGYNDDETRPDPTVITTIVQHFKTLGYKVGINQPFSNSKTFAVPVSYHTVMIEVNKRLYMTEPTLDRTDHFEQLRHDIQTLYALLLK